MNLTPTTFDEIIDLLKGCDDAYFNTDDTPLTDREYDLLKRKAFALDPSDDYFLKVGADIRGGKISLPYQMGSLNQIYEGEVESWVKKYNIGSESTVITHKLDGASCLLVYNSGKLSIAYSRGDGLRGADITRHIKAIPSVPKEIDTDVTYFVVRAEVIMKNDTFALHYANDFKNPRNFVAGALNRKETEASVLKNMDVVAYEIVAVSRNGQVVSLTTKTEMLELLRAQQFLVVDYSTTTGGNINDSFLTHKLITARQDSPYELDGVVVTVENYAAIDLHSKSSSLNPEHSIKYKIVGDVVFNATIRDIHFNISKNGYIKGYAEFDPPVQFNGVTVTKATIFNAKFVYDNKLGPGAIVKLVRSGEVIPYIISVVQSAIK